MTIGTTLLPASLGATIVAEGSQSFLNITAPTLVKTVGGRLMRVNVIVAGTADGMAYDQAVITPNNAKRIAYIPMEVGNYEINMPCQTGILVVPPTGSTIAVSFC